MLNLIPHRVRRRGKPPGLSNPRRAQRVQVFQVPTFRAQQHRHVEEVAVVTVPWSVPGLYHALCDGLVEG